MNKIIEELGIDETLTKVHKQKQKKYNSVRSKTVQKEDYNFMADLLFLPTTKEKYKYLFVIVDLFSREFDIEPIKTKTPEAVLKAYLACIKRKHINLAYASIKTDSGNEFKGVFQAYLKKNNIMKKTGIANRHTQLSTVESLNKQLGRLFIGYLNSIEVKTGKTYREWTDILSKVRIKLNKFRKDLTPDPIAAEIQPLPDYEPKFKIGDLVRYKLDAPEDLLGNKQITKEFRFIIW